MVELSRNAYNTAKHKYSMNVVGKKTKKVYLEALK